MLMIKTKQIVVKDADEKWQNVQETIYNVYYAKILTKVRDVLHTIAEVLGLPIKITSKKSDLFFTREK